MIKKTINNYLLQKTIEVPNIVGYSKTLKKRLKESTGEIVDEECIIIYVKEKKPLKLLSDREIIPRRIDDIPTDIRTVGEWRIPTYVERAFKEEKTRKIRPVIAGISVGNLSITAGTYGWFYKDKKGNIVGGTNAHVNSEDPSKEYSSEKRILQPGSYDGGTKEDIIGEYIWHKQIYPIINNSDCSISNGIVKILNFIYKILDRKTRFKVYREYVNHIDFGTFTIDVDYDIKFIDYNIEEGFLGVGHGFAGSNSTSLICKGKHIEVEGYKPINTSFVRVKDNDIVYKTGRTSCFSSAKVIDEKGVSQVNYGNFVAIFEDVIITDGPLLKPGDSGSFVFKKENNK
jgi:hypothetical protein